VEFLSGSAVLDAVWELAREEPREPLRVAVAYVGRDAPTTLPLRDGDTIVINGSDIAVASGATDPRAVKVWLESGARVVNHPRLHAKVFVSGDTAIIGSANVSRRAHSDAVAEAAIRTTGRSIVGQARAFIDDLIMTVGEDIDLDWVRDAKQRFPVKLPKPRWEEKPPTDTKRFRLFLGWWCAPHKATQEERRIFDKVVAECARDFRPRARYEPGVVYETISEQTPLDFFRPGDMIVRLHEDEPTLVEVRAIQRVPRSKSLLVILRCDTRLGSYPHADLEQALKAVGGKLPLDEPPYNGRWLTRRAERKAILDLWNLPDPGQPRSRRHLTATPE